MKASDFFSMNPQQGESVHVLCLPRKSDRIFNRLVKENSIQRTELIDTRSTLNEKIADCKRLEESNNRNLRKRLEKEMSRLHVLNGDLEGRNVETSINTESKQFLLHLKVLMASEDQDSEKQIDTSSDHSDDSSRVSVAADSMNRSYLEVASASHDKQQPYGKPSMHLTRSIEDHNKWTQVKRAGSRRNASRRSAFRNAKKTAAEETEAQRNATLLGLVFI